MLRYWLASAAALALTAGAVQAQEVLPRTTILAQPAPPTVVILPAAPPPPAVVTVTRSVPVAVPAPLPVIGVPPGAVAVTKTERTVDANGVQTDKVQTYERKESFGAGDGALTSTTTTNSTGQAIVTVPGTTTTTTQTTTTRYQ